MTWGCKNQQFVCGTCKRSACPATFCMEWTCNLAFRCCVCAKKITSTVSPVSFSGSNIWWAESIEFGPLEFWRARICDDPWAMYLGHRAFVWPVEPRGGFGISQRFFRDQECFDFFHLQDTSHIAKKDKQTRHNLCHRKKNGWKWDIFVILNQVSAALGCNMQQELHWN